jgi:protein-export chaperone SecB
MTDETKGQHPGGNGQGGAAPGDGQGPAEQHPPIVINAQYVKDLSFEAPSAPAVFAQLQRQQPNISVKCDVQARALDTASNLYEVLLQLSSECKAGEEVAFVVELTYGGVFTLNVRPEDVRPVLLIECPRILFPFARHVVATSTMNGGFLPLMLGPIDFASLYQNQSIAPQEGESVTIV